MATIHPIRLRLSNAYLVKGERPILVDAGSPGEAGAIEAALDAHGIQLAELALIVHTHAHSDHLGATAELVRRSGVATALHPGDREALRRGHNGRLAGRGLRGQAMARLFSGRRFQPVDPDLWLEPGPSLQACGVDAEVVATPGHTAGSISILFPDGQAIVGDLVMGGHLGGRIRPVVPRRHYFAEDMTALRDSLAALLSRETAVWHPGHGGPLDAAAVRALAARHGIV